MPNLLFINKSSCFGCAACQFVCPVHAICLKEDEEGFTYPIIDMQSCISCNKCREVCPAHHQVESATSVRYYALRCHDEKLLQQSTSGGAFSVLADLIIKQGGLVCGAAYDASFHVYHQLTADIAPLRKSKYVQSTLDVCFSDIQLSLSQGKQVLFSGTPCQCHAVKNCFSQEPNLLLAALVCRGVQSPRF